MLLGSDELAKFLKLSPLFLGNGRLVMSHIGKVSSSMVITCSLKSKIIPNSFIDSVPMIRSNAGLLLSLSYSTISGCKVTYCDCILRLNFKLALSLCVESPIQRAP